MLGYQEADIQALIDRFAKDPNWNGGWHYDRGGIPETMLAMRIETLTRYGWNEILAEKFPTQAKRDAEIRRRAEPWAKEFDPNSSVTMRRAGVRYNAEKDFSKIRDTEFGHSATGLEWAKWGPTLKAFVEGLSR